MSEGVFQLTRPRRHQEDDLQRAVHRYLSWSLPDRCKHFSVPNGGWRHPGEAARMAGMGVRPGIPDIEIIHEGHPLFLELKTEVGRLSQIQRQMMRELEDAGAECFVCRSLEDVARTLSECGVRLRGKLNV